MFPTGTFTLATLADTETLATQLAAQLRKGDVVALAGDLGAGKTTFARYLIHALGHVGDVPSPTYTILQQYDLPLAPVAHFDLYRIKSVAELEELGWFDLLADNITLVEWPERAGGYLPTRHIAITFTLKEKGRECEIIPPL